MAIVSNSKRENNKNNVSTPLGKDTLTEVRVLDIILSSSHPKFRNNNDIGTIFYTILGSPDARRLYPSRAKPLFPFIKNYPLKDEIVVIINLYGLEGGGEITEGKEDYYITTINIWNSPHHNSIPNYQTTLKAEGGNNSIHGDYFEDQGILPLQPYEGDIILEGRFGNSIRFGSTNIIQETDSAYKSGDKLGLNTWSKNYYSENGNPITIIRNGQKSQSNNINPLTENINDNFSSIYLTNNQQIEEFIPASIYQASFGSNLEITENIVEIEEISEPEMQWNEEEELKEDEIFNSPITSGEEVGCFLENTKITMGDNSKKNIEDIIIGDLVKAFNTDTNKVINSTVTEIFTHPNIKEYYIINNNLKVTGNHPLWINNEWKEVNTLNIGDKLLNLDGSKTIIKSIEIIKNNTTVYNFEVDNVHNYFAEGYLVHNKLPMMSVDEERDPPQALLPSELPRPWSETIGQSPQELTEELAVDIAWIVIADEGDSKDWDDLSIDSANLTYIGLLHWTTGGANSFYTGLENYGKQKHDDKDYVANKYFKNSGFTTTEKLRIFNRAANGKELHISRNIVKRRGAPKGMTKSGKDQSWGGRGIDTSFDYVFGDSIAFGINKYAKAKGWQKIGANPKTILSEIENFNDNMKGKKVLLSSGYSNNVWHGQDSITILSQIQHLRRLGATVYLLGVSNTLQQFLDDEEYNINGNHNQILKGITNNRAIFLDGFTASDDNVHPPSSKDLYNSIKNKIKSEAKETRYKQYKGEFMRYEPMTGTDIYNTLASEVVSKIKKNISEYNNGDEINTENWDFYPSKWESDMKAFISSPEGKAAQGYGIIEHHYDNIKKGIDLSDDLGRKWSTAREYAQAMMWLNSAKGHYSVWGKRLKWDAEMMLRAYCVGESESISPCRNRCNIINDEFPPASGGSYKWEGCNRGKSRDYHKDKKVTKSARTKYIGNDCDKQYSDCLKEEVIEYLLSI